MSSTSLHSEDVQKLAGRRTAAGKQLSTRRCRHTIVYFTAGYQRRYFSGNCKRGILRIGRECEQHCLWVYIWYSVATGAMQNLVPEWFDFKLSSGLRVLLEIKSYQYGWCGKLTRVSLMQQKQDRFYATQRWFAIFLPCLFYCTLGQCCDWCTTSQICHFCIFLTLRYN